ncbi:MAG: hypothetical protein K0B11_19445 [Mariniphaga sp.]|nr:hypothetical protein [Mariniphaga sp.]
MKNNKLYVVLFIFILLYSIYETFLFFDIKNTCKGYIKIIENNEIEKSIAEYNIADYLEISYYNNDEFNEYSGNLISEYELDNKLIFFFREGVCLKCIEEELSDIDSMLIGTIKIEDIVLIAQSTDNDLFSNAIFEKYLNRYKTIWISSDEYFKPLAQKPYYFIANNSYSSRFLYVPELIPSYKNDYFKKVIPKVFNSK